MISYNIVGIILVVVIHTADYIKSEVTAPIAAPNT